MVTLVGGIVALVLGFLGLVYWWSAMVIVLKAGIPLVLLVGGALATYLGIEEWKESQAGDQTDDVSFRDSEVERYRAEAEKLKRELEALRRIKAENQDS
jgi:hypothetical protein